MQALRIKPKNQSNHLVDDLCDNHNLQRKNIYLHENQNNKDKVKNNVSERVVTKVVIK